jgi:hypothetical protein
LILSVLATTLGALAFTAAPALAAAPEAPSAVTVESITATTANLRGVLNPGTLAEPPQEGTYEFIYNETVAGKGCKEGFKSKRGLSFGNSGEEVFEGSFGIPVSSTAPPFVPGLTGLAPGTQYSVCLLARNLKGEEGVGAENTFRTAEEPEKKPAEPITAKTATLNGVLNPHNEFEAGTYEFLYKQSATECQLDEAERNKGLSQSATPAELSTAESPQPVSAEVTELQPGGTYSFCLLERDASGQQAAINTPETFTTPIAAPAIGEEQVTHVTETGATLQAQIDPDGAETTYHFEYDTTPYTTSAPHGTSITKEGVNTEVNIGAGTSPVPVEVQLNGLTPGVTYYYRVLAYNAQSPTGTPGPDKTLTTWETPTTAETCSNAKLRTEQPFGLLLPDCRAYEQVSPLDKNDNDIMLPGAGGEGEDMARASVSGEAITYDSFGSFADPAGARFLGRYVSRRGAGGWSTQNITPPYSSQHTSTEAPYESLVFTPDLSMGVVGDRVAGCENLYLADIASSSYQVMMECGNEPWVDGASTDLRHIVFTPVNGGSLYEWVGGQLSEVDVANDGSRIRAHAGGFGGRSGGTVFMRADEWHAVSDDGLRVFFTDVEDGTADYGQLYVRENPEQPQSALGLQGECTESGKACTVEVSASQRTTADSHGPQDAEYLGASVDGSKVFFDSRAELTNNANTGGADNAANLYEYDLKSGVLTDLTLDAGEPEGAAVLGMVTAAQDGSYVYYVADGVLAPGAAPGNCAAHPTESPPGATCNLYVQHYNGTEWTPPAFIATLAGGDAEDWMKGGLIDGEGVGGPANNIARITPDGTHLAFLSNKRLTGYDNQPAEPADCESESYGGGSIPCSEVFSFDATQPVSPENPVCVSCNPSGARPVGPSRLSEIENQATPFYYTSRNFSEDGSRLFFDSRDALVSRASNGRQNVYEYQGGHVYLISDGAGNFDSSFLDASPSGDDVFIGTEDQLLPQDTDFRIDVYDARVGGGFPVSASPPACDNGDSCKPPVSPQPGVFGAPASATFSGAGNLTPTPPPPPKPKTAAQIRAEKLTKALKACKKDKKKSKRKSCEKQARKKYGASKAKNAGNERRAK